MNNKDIVKQITGKDEEQALIATKQMINDSNIELFELLVEQSDYLFQFVKENVVKRLEKSITAKNFNNLYNFLNCYSSDYESVFISAFRVFGRIDAKKNFTEYLKTGSIAQKTYAAKYFAYTKDYSVIDLLIEYAFSDNDYLSDACAYTLGILNDTKSYEIALEKLNKEDDFEKLAGLNFFVSYIKNPPMKEIFSALDKTNMPENFAGKIAYLTPLTSLLQEDTVNALYVIDYILMGFGEILPLSEVFNYDLYNVIGMLSDFRETECTSKIATILLRAKSKFETICTNDEYLFDETKDTKNELNDIYTMLKSFDNLFWQHQEDLIIKELEQDRVSILSALDVIKELNLKSTIPAILNLIYEHYDETVLCEAMSCLKQFDAIKNMPKDDVIPRISNENLKAIVENYYI